MNRLKINNKTINLRDAFGAIPDWFQQTIQRTMESLLQENNQTDVQEEKAQGSSSPK